MLRSATSRSSAGRSATADATPDVYWLASSEPSTATPSAPPSSRVVSFVAEPMPARSRGTAAISCVVIGVIVIAMPPASTHIVTSELEVGVSTRNRAIAGEPEADERRARPRPTLSAPKRATSFGVCGATAIITTEIGSSRTAAPSGE